MIRLNEFDLNFPKIDRVPELYDLAWYSLEHIVLFEFVLDQSHGQLRRVNRYINLAEYIRNSAYVVLMPVSNHKTFDFAVVLFQIGRVRKNKVNAKHVVLGKSHPAVDHNDAVSILESRDIHADSFKASERYDLKFLPDDALTIGLPCCVPGIHGICSVVLIIQVFPPFRSKLNLHVVLQQFRKYLHQSFEQLFVRHRDIFRLPGALVGYIFQYHSFRVSFRCIRYQKVIGPVHTRLLNDVKFMIIVTFIFKCN